MMYSSPSLYQYLLILLYLIKVNFRLDHSQQMTLDKCQVFDQYQNQVYLFVEELFSQQHMCWLIGNNAQIKSGYKYKQIYDSNRMRFFSIYLQLRGETQIFIKIIIWNNLFLLYNQSYFKEQSQKFSNQSFRIVGVGDNQLRNLYFKENGI
ncbi:hypothetical protein pb186bvf_018761 [Paramecium bursaria]